MQPNENRTAGQDEAADGANNSQSAFEPGTSFSDDSSGPGVASELPAWLQNFGGVVGESRDVPGGRAADAQPAAGAPDQAQQANQPGSAGSDASFFSDDDLPEWLRALSVESESAASPAPAAVAAPSNGVSQATITVPPVSRAWVTESDVAEISTGASLFSSLVHVIDTRPDVVAVEAAVAPSPAPRTAARSQPAPEPVVPVSTRDEGRWSTARVLAVVAIIILTLIVFVMLGGN